jgi:hypothetical protein
MMSWCGGAAARGRGQACVVRGVGARVRGDEVQQQEVVSDPAHARHAYLCGLFDGPQAARFGVEHLARCLAIARRPLGEEDGLLGLDASRASDGASAHGRDGAHALAQVALDEAAQSFNFKC